MSNCARYGRDGRKSVCPEHRALGLVSGADAHSRWMHNGRQPRDGHAAVWQSITRPQPRYDNWSRVVDYGGEWSRQERLLTGGHVL